MAMRKLLLTLFVLPALITAGQTPLHALIAKKTTVAGLTPPTFIQESETAWNSTTSPKTTASMTVQTGDVLVAYSIVEDHAATVSITNSGTAQTWTQQQLINVTDYTKIYIWTAIASANTSFTVSFTRSATARFFGGNVLTFRSSGGVGASIATNNSTGDPAVTLLTTAANSAVVTVIGDWSAVDGTTRTWNTVNSITPTSGNGLEVTYSRDASNYTRYAAYWNDVGAVGNKVLGTQLPDGMKWSIAAVEVKGL